MNKTSKISVLAAVFVVAIFVVAAFAVTYNHAFAIADGGGDGGCCGGGEGGGGGGGEPGGGEIMPEPRHVRCDFLTVNKATVPHAGGNVTLKWQTSHATSVSITGIGAVGASGSRTVFVDKNTTFTLTAKGFGGSDSCSVAVKVHPPADKPAECLFLKASPTVVGENGGNVTLSWDTHNATSVRISGLGLVDKSGSRTVFVDSTRTFTLTAVGTGGNDTCTVTVKVKPPVDKPAECLFLNASKTVVGEDGANVTLSWDTHNATSVSINHGIGNVAKSGSRTVFVDSTRTYVLTAVGTGGNDTCTVKITKKPVEEKAPRCDFFKASDSDVEEGDRVTLSWGTTNADRVTITPDIGDVADDGSITVTVDDDTTYTLRVRNAAGDEDTCSVTVRVDEDEDRKTPRCTLKISDDEVKRGEKVTLSWKTTNVDDIRIRDDHGNTVFDTDDYSKSERKRYFNGSIDLVINKSTKFTMTAGGVDGGSRTCRVDVDVEDIAIYEKRDQGYVIALASVPYTGFEAGPLLTFLFYALLTLWALFMAYILVIKKSSIFGFSLYSQDGGISETDMHNRKKVEALVAKYAGTTWK